MHKLFKRCLIPRVFLTSIILLSTAFLGSFAYGGHPSENENLALDLTADEKAWLDAHPVIRLGIDRNFAPYEWIDEAGNYKGMAADYLKLLEPRLGVRFEPVRNKKSWGDVLEAARKGEFDMVSCLVQTGDRDAYLDFSEPYLSSVAVIISEQSRGYIGTLDRLSGKTVAIHKGHYTNELLKVNYPDIRIVNTSNIQEALHMVAEGRAEAFVGDATAASYVMKQEGLLNLSFSGQTEYQSEFRIGVYQGNTLLSSIIGKALDSITQAERDAIYDHWRGMEIQTGIRPEQLIKYGAGVLALFLIFAYWNYRLRVSEQAYRKSDLAHRKSVRAHRESEQAHRRSEQRFRNLVETTNGIVWEADAQSFVVTYISDNAERLLGYPAVEWLQPGFWQEHIYSEDRGCAVQYTVDQTGLQEDHDFEYRFLTKAGDIVWLRDMVSVVVENGKPRWLRGIILDITEVKQADLLIKQSEQRFRELIESLPAIAVQGYDKERNVVYWNAASSALYGYTRDEALGRKLEDLIIPDEMRVQAIQDHQYWLKTGIAIPAGEMELKHKEGQMIPVFSSHVMLNKGLGEGDMFCIDISLAEQKRVTKELTYMASYDSLTQLPNRRTFLDRLRQQVKKSKRNGRQVALMLLDLDHFKEVNDTLGHDIGDLLLKEAAQRLNQCLRDSDTVARLGGDEFTVILGDLEDSSVIERIAQNILQQLATPFYLKRETVYVSCSIGITLYPFDSFDIDVLLKNADQAMYAAKDMGRNRYSYFTASMEVAALERRQLSNDLRVAMEDKQFQLHYQPIVELSSGQIYKAEALLRWQHPKRGLIPPTDFIPVAEESGIIVDIGNWVFSQALQQVAQWRRKYSPDFQVSINTSPVQFRSEECRQQEWFAQLSKAGLSGQAIVIEITEGVLMEDSPVVRDKLLGFRDAFMEVALDDFGTGYSSLSYLKRFHIDYLKIDRSFVSNLTSDSNDMALCEAIILMAHKLGIKVVAEGVETQEQSDLLTAAGCDYGQGYLYSKPVPVEQFEGLFESLDVLE
ncbi:MAG: EAL domain-containing protein [Amphritea sp.]